MESRKGKKVFYGILAVTIDSNITKVEHLKGTRFAFGNEAATFGRYLSQLSFSRFITGKYLIMLKAIKQVALLLLLGLFSTTARAETTFTIGIVPQFEPQKLASIWLPILDELAKQTGFSFKMIGPASIPEFEVAFQKGAFDFVYMNPYHATLAANSQGYIPLVRDGGRELTGVLVVRQDNPIKSIKELQGKPVAFPAPNALGASLLMRTELELMHAVKVIPKYVQTHSSVYFNVHFGLTEAGGGVLGTLGRQPQEIRDGLRILYQTRGMPPHPIVAHPRIPEDVRNKVKAGLLALGGTETGAALLRKVPMKKIIAASAEDYKVLSTWGLEAFYVEP